MWEKKFGVYEYWKTKMFEKLLFSEMTVFDVGANVGYYTLLSAALVGPRGVVVAFEPLKYLCDDISESSRRSGYTNVYTMQAAVGESFGQAMFYPGRKSGWGSLRPTSKQTDNSKAALSVPVISLDALTRDQPNCKPDLIKIDVEGLEPEVLRGSREILELTRPLLVIDIDHGSGIYHRSIECILFECNYAIFSVSIPPVHLPRIPSEIKDVLAIPSEIVDKVIPYLT